MTLRVNSTPLGIPITIDGKAYTTPAVFPTNPMVASWRFLCDIKDTDLAPSFIAQKILDSGANGSYFSSFIDSWVGTGRTWDIAYAQEIHNRGMLAEWLPVYWSVMQSGLWDEFFQDVLHNTGGAQDLWVSRMATTVSEVKPDIVVLYNEPQGELSDRTTAYMNEYVALCNREMAALNAVKAGLIFVVHGVPFFNLSTVSSINFVVPTDCSLLYSLHYYYAYDGGYPPYSYAQQLYWDAVTSQDFINARNALYSEWLNDYGVQDIWNRGKTVIFDELGTNIANPHIAEFLNDAYSFCVNNHIGFNALNNIPSNPAYQYPGQIFNNDWSLNSIGNVWKNYI